MNTLILNADGMPLSMLPVSARNWQTAIRHVYADEASVLHEYDNWEVRSPSMTIKVPAVLIMKSYRKAKKYIRFSKANIKLRDRYTCQYCCERFKESQLTMDHVIPRSHGGPLSWENIVAACGPCNGGRSDNVSIRPKRMPYRPDYWELLSIRQQYPLVIPHPSWAYYCPWPEEMIKVQ